MNKAYTILLLFLFSTFFILAQQEKVNGVENQQVGDMFTFENAKTVDKIEYYKEFINRHPGAKELNLAWERIYELAYLQTQKENTSKAYKIFSDTYPKSKQLSKAVEMFKERQFFENTKAGNWNSFRLFIKNNSKSIWKSVAEDSIISIGKRTEDLNILSYCVDNFNSAKRDNLMLFFHDIYTNDGEKETLDLFYARYNETIFKSVRIKDYEIANLGDQLTLENPYDAKDYIKYDTYIRLAAPREKAFVALQRLISPFISKKDWKSALDITKTYSKYFGKTNKEIIELISILGSKQTKSIKIYSAGNLINTTGGGEYMPLITADDKQMYFCGRDRIDNLGGEDIFVSNKKNGYWDTGHLVMNLSAVETNDAPLSISTDANTLLVFKSGKLYYANKTADGWSNAIEYPKQINSGNWQADAMLTSDGRGLIFSSTKAGGYNLYRNRQKYHGDILYPSDIYISLLNDLDEWGEPINLGKVINTPYSDRMPFLHPDMKTLYFSSEGHGGLGKMDIFKSTRLADSCWNCWSEPVNLGKEINTNESDADFKITNQGDKAYFSYEKITYFENSTIFLLDISGSMSGHKFDALKKATQTVCKKAIQNNNEVAIMTFAGDCTNPIVSIFPFSKNTNLLNQFVDGLKTYDGTPMYEAYLAACDYMKKYSSKSSKNKTITLMTDGAAISCNSLNDILTKIKSKDEIYKTQTIAYDVPEKSIAHSDLKSIAEFSGGRFHPTGNFEDLTSTFEGSVNEIFNVNSANYDKDIYWINLPHDIRPKKVTTLSGRVLDKNNKPINAKIILEDLETGEIVGKSKSDPKDGSFFIVLPSGKVYGYYIDEDGYYPVSENVDLLNDDKPTQIEKDIKVTTFNQIMNEGIVVPMNNLFFNFAESTLLPYSIPELKRVASIIKKSGFKVQIIGHTDCVGDNEMNQVLSEKRAQSVKDFLVTEGCRSDQLITKGYGETKPAVSNSTEIGRTKNRRVELKFIK